MKKWLRNLKIKQVNVNELDDRTLLLNVYVTQAATFIIGMIVLLFQRRNVISLFAFPEYWTWLIWGTLSAGAVIAANMILSRWVPEHVTDDGGINERIFARRSLWHIALLCFVVAVCEEVLFRGAIQHAWGPYWTSILFAVIHFRYLQHWLMTGLVFAISYGLGWIYIQTGTLWTPILAHFLIDFVMGCIIRFRRDA